MHEWNGKRIGGSQIIEWNGIRIRQKQVTIMALLYKYRGLTNEHLRNLIYGHLDSEKSGQKANISRFVKDLRDKKLINSSSCFPYSKELIHYLSQKGVDFIVTELNISKDNDPLNGFKDVYGLFDANTLKPPLNNIEHQMMFLDTVIKLEKNGFATRHNLYAVKRYKYLKEYPNYMLELEGKVRPDGEVYKNGFAPIEIDTGTERFDHLLKKFNNYRRYFEYLDSINEPKKWKIILFKTKAGSNKNLLTDTRWQTIMRAAFAGLSNYIWNTKVVNIDSPLEKNSDYLINNLDILEAFNLELPPEH